MKKINQDMLTQARNFWMLSTIIRRGLLDEVTNRRKPLKPQEMIDRINHFLNRFNWSASMLTRIGELQEIAHEKLEQKNEQASRRSLRTASK